MSSVTSDLEPLVRRTAAANSDFLPANRRAELIGPLLWDPVRAVRIQAASSLAEVPNALLKPDQQKKLPEVIGEFEAPGGGEAFVFERQEDGSWLETATLRPEGVETWLFGQIGDH